MRFTTLVISTLLAGLVGAQEDEGKLSTIKVGGLERTYILHLPPNVKAGQKLPVVFAFHGGSGNAAQMERFCQFDRVADKEGFIVVYPNGIDKTFNDGRVVEKSTAHRENIDDMGFVSALLDLVIKEHNADPARIYSTGISNGAIFSHRLAAEMSDRFAAIAGVCGSLAEPLEKSFAPKEPVSILVMNGTEDPLLPYDGGQIALNRGRIISTNEILKKWITADGCKKIGADDPVIDADRRDGTSVETTHWTGGKNGTEVVLMKVIGGGHTWPSGPQYLPKLLIGKVSRDIDASAVIWEFFANHPKKADK